METFPVVVNLVIMQADPMDQEKMRFAFIEEENILGLPERYLDGKTTAYDACVELADRYIHADLNWITIGPVRFYDMTLHEGREIALIFKATIPDTIRLKKGIQWFSYEELRLAQKRIRKEHFRVFRETLAF